MRPCFRCAFGWTIRVRRSSRGCSGSSRRSLDRFRDFTPKRITALELPRIDPHRLPQIRQCLPQLPHEAIIGAAVGEEELDHRRGLPGWGKGNGAGYEKRATVRSWPMFCSDDFDVMRLTTPC